jgi:NAD(P)-dependent dehydrogenase (short-subunit alcohol dehydrogenase family)
VIKVHLRGTFAPTRHAVEYWRNRTKAGETNDARIINTTSPSGIYGNVGQTNYGAAKAGIAPFTIIAAMELERYGVTVNAIAPIVVWLGSPESASITGRVFNFQGDHLSVAEGWVEGPAADKGDRWDPAELGKIVPDLVAKAAPNANMAGKRK